MDIPLLNLAMAVLNHDQKDSVSEEGEVISVILSRNTLNSWLCAYIYVIFLECSAFPYFHHSSKAGQSTNSFGRTF